MNQPPFIESLESRIAPAILATTLTFVKPTTATYTDVDGDLVTVKFSKAILSPANVASVLIIGPVDPTHDQLQRIDLTAGGLAKPAAGTTITITVVPQESGDGFANVGYINGTGLDLGAVTIRGDLGAIDAGDAKTKTPGLKSLTVQSFGTLGMTTGAPDLHSDIVGALSKLTVKGTMKDASLDVSGGKDGKLGPVTIGVSLIGGSGVRSGTLHSSGDMGLVKIGSDVSGGSNNGAGAILSDGKIAGVTIGGALNGGGTFAAGLGAGVIYSVGNLGKVNIAGDFFGGIGDSSGAILTDAKMGDVHIGGAFRGGIVKIGGGTPRDGYIASGGDMGKITIDGDMIGSFIPYAGTIKSGGKIAAVTVGGRIIGGDDHSGSILSAGTIGSIKIGGDLSGGGGPSSGSILSDGDLKLVKIGGNLFGSQKDKTGTISGKKLGLITVSGAVAGGNSSTAFSFTDSGAIEGTSIQSLTIGSLRGGSASNETLIRTGYVSATTIKSLTIKGGVQGGSISGSGTLVDSGSIQADHIDKILIGGSLQTLGLGSASTGTIMRSGAIGAGHDIGSIKILGSVLGAEDDGKGVVPVIISAAGKAKPSKTADVAIGSLTIGGDVARANIFAGYTPAGAPANGGAQIGTVNVTGNWTASNLVAGAMNTASGNKYFGDGNDAAFSGGSPAAISKIASLSIGGVIGGTAGTGDHYGFVAHVISTFKIGGIKIPLPPAVSTFVLGANDDVSVHLI